MASADKQDNDEAGVSDQECLSFKDSCFKHAGAQPQGRGVVAGFTNFVLDIPKALLQLGCERRQAVPHVLHPDADGVFRIGRRWGLRVVCLSDTHNKHRQLTVPAGDILIHAGDFTQFGKDDHAQDFNSWLGELPHAQKIVVFGNHECNAPWNKRAAEILTNATFLRNEGCTTTKDMNVFGTDFFWNVSGQNPYFEAIPTKTDVLIAHNPPRGFGDGASKPGGCPALRETIRKVCPTLVISGHLHYGYGVVSAKLLGKAETIFVNAANCGSGKEERLIKHDPVVLDI